MFDVQQYTIELERQNGIFYAGEVVKGCAGDKARHKCRAVRVRLRGHGKCHWSEGSGDNRRDFYGRKVYQEERFTVFGNYTNTALLDEAGCDAEFGHAAGDGVMFIPVEEREITRSLPLILRVMDYDFGKRDDLLGEALVDAKDLVDSEEEVTIQLRRNGQPVMGQDGVQSTVTVAADVVPLDKFFAKAGDANSMATHILRLQALRASNLRKADWFGKNDVYVQVYRAPSEVSKHQAFPNPVKTAILPAGRHVYPFVFSLRVDAPGTAEGMGDSQTYVRYELYANIDKAYWADPSTKRAITVIPNRPLPKLPLLGPAFSTLSEEAANCDCNCCSCCPAGELTLRLTLDRQAYAAGEPFGYEVEAENHTESEALCTLYVRRAILLQTTSKNYHRTHRRFRDQNILTATVPPGETIILNGHESGAKVPADLPPSFFGASGSQTAMRDPLMWTYALHAKLKTPGTMGCGSATNVFIPIMISPAAPYRELPDDPPAMIEILSPTGYSEIQEKYWDIQEHAHQSLARSLYFPTITGEEDFEKFGSLAPSGEPVNIWNREDDNATTAREELEYQPVTILWNTPPAPIVSIPEEAESEVKTGDGGELSALLEEMGRKDARRAVAEWVQIYPAEASALSPNDVSAILRSVLFSLEQPSVARELAAALAEAGPNGLTCAHVVAAMQACSFSKADVAIAMVPVGLADPENVQSILACASSWEQSRIERAMTDP